MTRNRKSAKAAGARFERQIADYLRDALDAPHIDRQVKVGRRDLGDIRGVQINGKPLAIECKDVATLALPQWTREAQQEALNLGAVAGLVIAKRRGTTDPGQQWVACTLDDLIRIIQTAGGPK